MLETQDDDALELRSRGVNVGDLRAVGLGVVELRGRIRDRSRGALGVERQGKGGKSHDGDDSAHGIPLGSLIGAEPCARL